MVASKIPRLPAGARGAKKRGRPPLPDDQRRIKVWTSLDAATLAALEALYPGVPVHEQLRRVCAQVAG